MKTRWTHKQTGRNLQGKGTSSGYKTVTASQPKQSSLTSSCVKPFTGKVFYLDLPSNKTSESLESDIKELGGTVEKFFSKEIKYLVSNKKEARYGNWLRKNSPVPSPDSGHSSSHPGSNPHKPGSRGDNVKGKSLNQSDTFVTSRGKTLVDRAVNEQRKLHTSKILSNALDWGVKILYIDDLRAYLQKKKKAVGRLYPATMTVRTNVRADVAVKQHFQKCNGGRISKPFVKVEDSSRHYRPIYISLPNMPQFNLRGLPPCSPFLADDKDSPGKKHRNREVKASASEEKARNCRKKNREKRAGGYCECCMIKYENITRHLLSDCHQAFSKGDQYSVLDKVISTMNFKFSTALNQAKRSKCGASSLFKQRHTGDLHLSEIINQQQQSSGEGPCSGQASKMATFTAAAAPSSREEKHDDTSTDGPRSKSSGSSQDSRTSHNRRFSQSHVETAPPPALDDVSVHVRTDQQQTPEITGTNLPEKQELSIPTQTFSPMRKIKRKVRVYKRKRQKVELPFGCVKQGFALEDSKLKLLEVFQSSDGMDVEFLGFKD